jgi:hypothetical protein
MKRRVAEGTEEMSSTFLSSPQGHGDTKVRDAFGMGFELQRISLFE